MRKKGGRNKKGKESDKRKTRMYNQKEKNGAKQNGKAEREKYGECKE